MTRREVNEALEKAIVALRAYKSGQFDKSADLLKEHYDAQIARNTEMLIKESFSVGAAGAPCPCCNGSGRK